MAESPSSSKPLGALDLPVDGEASERTKDGIDSGSSGAQSTVAVNDINGPNDDASTFADLGVVGGADASPDSGVADPGATITGEHTVLDERPAQFARPPVFYVDREPYFTANFLKQQLGAMYQDFFEEENDDDEFVRETDSEMVVPVAAAPAAQDAPSDLVLATPPRKATAWAAVIVAIVCFTWFGRTLSNVLAPIALAVFLSYLIVPMATMFTRFRLPKSAGYLLSSTLIAGVFFGVGAIISASVAEFRSNFTVYEQNLDHLMLRLSAFARNVGLIRSGDSLKVHDLIEALPVGGVQGMISDGASYMFSFMSYIIVTSFFMMFMIWESERFAYRVRTAYSHAAAERILQVVEQLNDDIQRYVVLKVIVSAWTAGLAYVVMSLCGLDFAGVLTLIIFLANFIPYIGSVVATVIPGVVALLQFPSWREALIVVAGITLIQQLIGNILEPRLQGRRLNLSPLMILVALAYFGWMWGIVGMIVSVPIASGLRLIFEQFDVTRSIAKMMRNI